MAANALAMAQRMLDGVPAAGLRNGNFISNSAMPASSHVRPRAMWVLKGADGGDPVTSSLVEAIAWSTRVDEDSATRNALPADEKIDIEVGVLMALGRQVAWKFMPLVVKDLSPGEVHVIRHDAVAPVIHADHAEAVSDALLKWTGMATRMPGLAWYNAISYELHNHHHKPALTKRLATTTISVAGLKEWFAEKAAEEAEGIIAHDMYHPMTPDIKAQLARNVEWAKALSQIKFDNLRKRVPIKAPDCGLAMNYSVLISKARAYQEAMQYVTKEFDPPASLAVLMGLYVNAADTAAVERIVSELRAMSSHLEEPSAFVAGFMLGRERRASDDEDLDLKQAGKTNTILGSPAYARAAGQHPGTFNAGVETGFKKTSKWTFASGHADLKKRITASIAAAEVARQTAEAAAVAAGGAAIVV